MASSKASSHSQKKIVLQKYRTHLSNALSQCIEDVLPDLESSGAISIAQRNKVREYVNDKKTGNAVNYLMDEHMEKAASSVEVNKNFMKLLKAMKKAPKCTPLCKALAAVVEQHLMSDTSTDVSEVTKMLERLGNDITKLKEVIDARNRRWTDRFGTGELCL